ncbi:four helix bundle protein [Arthrospiribacter ruber]|uniref:Four helix bundle protein n=1 Tax=Arthrospiribacter ruber TaxID=2487934 RepID=A0A951IX44_9BACT|nr:four helix bundle protein [Arthrospiribacter ruber]
MHNYKELNVWKRGIKLTTEIYKVSELFPSEERFGLTSQIRRSAVSVPSNIAEGAGRRTDGEFINFLGIAHGSICELETQLYVAYELGFIDDKRFNIVTSEVSDIQRMLYSLILKFEKI